MKHLLVVKGKPYYSLVNHSPKSWPWWKFFTIRFVRTNPDLPRVSPKLHTFNMWVYTRHDAVCHFVAIDFRRDQ